jgi:transposase
MTTLLLPWANTKMMNLFLRQVAEDFHDCFVLLLLDQAGWHLAHALEIPENLLLVPLPPHSPELNPAEHLWEDIREKDLPNQAFGSLDDLEDALCAGVKRLAADPEHLRSLTNFSYMKITL